MKYVISIIVAFIACLLFLPKSGSTEIRNLPILLAILFLIIAWMLFRFFKYVVLMVKTKKLFRQKGMKVTKTSVLPWCSWFHGRYRMTFHKEGCDIHVVFLARKRRYQHYHFKDTEHIEFYNANRVVFRSIKVQGGTVSNLVETNLVGKQTLVWDTAPSEGQCKYVVLFDKMPYKVSDSHKREELASGDRICASDITVFDFQSLRAGLDSFVA